MRNLSDCGETKNDWVSQSVQESVSDSADASAGHAAVHDGFGVCRRDGHNDGGDALHRGDVGVWRSNQGIYFASAQ